MPPLSGASATGAAPTAISSAVAGAAPVINSDNTHKTRTTQPDIAAIALVHPWHFSFFGIFEFEERIRFKIKQASQD